MVVAAFSRSGDARREAMESVWVKAVRDEVATVKTRVVFKASSKQQLYLRPIQVKKQDCA